MSTEQLTGKVALVTGASRGIGNGIALCLARAGADVIVNYHSQRGAADELVSKIEALGRRAVAIGADVADREDVARLVRDGEAQLGPIDILVSNAIYSIREPFLETQWPNFERTVSVGIFGTFHVCQSVARSMVARGAKGQIIVIGSPHGHFPFKNASDYNVAKAGSLMLARTMAGELAHKGIRVNVVEPGWTDTPGEHRWYDDDDLDAAGKRMPLGRLGTSEDIGNAVVFLCTPEADYIANAVIRVDGAAGF